ncbi:MAG: class I SAM-dependent methyltransferase [Acidimicrobiia bacterium]|nr:class I SAM-dependent methyltransferase [Acidimicrobiia bacterium]
MEEYTDRFPLGFGPATYGASFADVYDRWYSGITDAEATARFMAARCEVTSVLELGVGTGRLVDALQRAGLSVIGLDSSAAMLKASTTNTSLITADMSAIPIRANAGIGGALCAFNTLFNLPTTDLQHDVFLQAASMLSGPLVVEAMTGIVLAEADSQSVGISRLTSDSVVLAATVVDHDAQTITGQHVDISQAGIQLRPWHLRWSTPSELDEMAERAGMRLAERYSDWNLTPFEESSEAHVSVYW